MYLYKFTPQKIGSSLQPYHVTRAGMKNETSTGWKTDKVHDDVHTNTNSEKKDQKPNSNKFIVNKKQITFKKDLDYKANDNHGRIMRDQQNRF